MQLTIKIANFAHGECYSNHYILFRIMLNRMTAAREVDETLVVIIKNDSLLTCGSPGAIALHCIERRHGYTCKTKHVRTDLASLWFCGHAVLMNRSPLYKFLYIF